MKIRKERKKVKKVVIVVIIAVFFALSSLFVLKSFGIFTLESSQKKEDRLEYYNSLEKAQTKEDYKDIIKFIHSNVEKSIIKNLEMLEENWKAKYNNELKKKKNPWAKPKTKEKDKENER